MASGLAVDIRGFKELDRRLAALPKRIENACFRKALRSSATKVAKRLKAGTPTLSVAATTSRRGDARRSVKVRVRVRRGGAWATVKYTKRPAAYMGMYERGTRRQIARPFFGRATGDLNEVTADFKAALRSAVESAEGAL